MKILEIWKTRFFIGTTFAWTGKILELESFQIILWHSFIICETEAIFQPNSKIYMVWFFSNLV